jgi:hypothetical protein
VKRYLLLFLLMLTATGYSAVNTATHYKWIHITDSLRVPLVFGVTQVGDSADLVISSVGKLYAKTETADSLLATWRGVRKVAGDSLWGNSPAYATRANVRDSLYAYNKFRLVPMTTTHNARYPRTNNDTLMLEDAIGDTAFFMWRVVGGAADVKGVQYMSVTLPWGVTQLDTVNINYLSSSATSATSAIDSIRIFVTTGLGQTAPAWQASYTTALASVGRAALLWGLNDGDFNGGEQVIVKFYTNVDAAAWVGVLSCKLRCSE